VPRRAACLLGADRFVTHARFMVCFCLLGHFYGAYRAPPVSKTFKSGTLSRLLVTHAPC